MDFENNLNRVADGYRRQGYEVLLHPGPDVLPSFAQDFKVEVLATRETGGVLAAVKKDREEMEADTELPRYAEITGKQQGWRFDFFVLGGESPLKKEPRNVHEPSEEDLVRALDEAERLVRAGFVPAAFLSAWAALEAAMRRRLRAEGQDCGWGTAPRTMLNELVSAGAFSTTDFRQLEKAFQLRSEIVHGFAAPGVDPTVVQFLLATARRLLTESQPAMQTA